MPQMRSAAPNWSVTAFHSVEVRNPSPKAEMAEDACSITL